MIAKVFRMSGYAIKCLFIKIRNGKKLRMKGIMPVSPTAEIRCGDGTIHIGRLDASPDTHFFSDGELRIGYGVMFNRGSKVVCLKKITIGDGCLFGPNVGIYDHNHKFGPDGVSHKEFSLGEIEIGKQCWIGANCVILKGTHIGDGCVIGAGSVISGDIPAHSLVSSGKDLRITSIEKR